MDKTLPLAFQALSDPTRLRLLNLLSEGEVCVCHLSEALRMVQPKVSRHLACLKRAGLVCSRKEGTWTHYRWAPQDHPVMQSAFRALRAWVSKDEPLLRERRRLKQCRCD